MIIFIVAVMRIKIKILIIYVLHVEGKEVLMELIIWSNLFNILWNLNQGREAHIKIFTKLWKTKKKMSNR